MVTPDQAIDAIRATGGAQPGNRALHAKGKLYRGTFTATPEAATLSRAAHLSGEASSRPGPILQRLRQSAATRQRAGRARYGGQVHPAGRIDNRRVHPDREAVPGQHTRRLHLAAAGDASRPDRSPAADRIHRHPSAVPVGAAGGQGSEQGAGQLRHRRVSRVARVPLDCRRRQRAIRALSLAARRRRGVPAGGRRESQGR